MSRFFITGTDTDVGKTVATCQLLRAFAGRGMRAVGMKPVASGCEWRDGALWNVDVAAHAAAGNVQAPLDWVSPYRFEPPIAPHLAARQAGVAIDLDVLVRYADLLEAQADVLLIEGAGGWLAPLSDRENIESLAVRFGVPVILVVGMRLGCLNHALLTVRAIAQSGLPLAGWIANQVDPDMDCYAENLASLRQRIAAPCLAEIGFSPEAAHTAVSGACLDALMLFQRSRPD